MSLATVLGELFTGNSVAIDAQRCLNSRHDRAGCSRCVEVCPTGAIRLHGRLPTPDEALCVRCGACVPACPTDAVAAGDLAERRLTDVCASLDNSTVTVACALHPEPQPSSPADAVVRHGRCLAALGAHRLLALTRSGTRQVALDVTWCGQCPIGGAADAVINNADTADGCLELFDAPRTVSVVSARDTAPSRVPSDRATGVLGAQRVLVTRRALFAGLRRQVQNARARAATAPPPPMRYARGPVADRLPHSLPASRSQLLDELATLQIRGGEGGSSRLDVATRALPFAPIVADAAACSGCGLCSRYCPTGALEFTSSPPGARLPESFSLAFRVAYCIDCGICIHACPDDALTYGTHLDRDGLVRSNWAPLASGTLVACSSCGLPTASSGAIARCFSCRLGAGVVSSLRDDAGLMADLLGRLPDANSDGDRVQEQAGDPLLATTDVAG